MRQLTQAQLDIINGAGEIVLMLALDHPDGWVRFSSRTHDWTDPEGVSWQGAAGVFDFGNGASAEGMDAEPLEVSLAVADSALISAFTDGKVMGATVYRSWCLINQAGEREGQSYIDFVGECETPVVNGQQITMRAVNRTIDAGKPNLVTLSPGWHQRRFPDDNFLEQVASLQDYNAFR